MVSLGLSYKYLYLLHGCLRVIWYGMGWICGGSGGRYVRRRKVGDGVLDSVSTIQYSTVRIW